MHLDSSITISQFALLAKPEEAHLERMEVTIAGKFSNEAIVVQRPHFVCEEFANLHNTAHEILRFTRKYGPIINRVGFDEHLFFVVIEEWQFHQNEFRTTWKQMAGTQQASDLARRNSWASKQGVRLVRSRNGTTIQLESVFDLINLCFFSLPSKYIRFCPVATCRKPFFIADHVNQKYCKAEECIGWGLRQAKLEYWNRNKEYLLARRKLDRSRSK